MVEFIKHFCADGITCGERPQRVRYEAVIGFPSKGIERYKIKVKEGHIKLIMLGII